MIDTVKFFECLHEKGIRFISGVPDSILKPIGHYLARDDHAFTHLVAANEGAAIGHAIGHFMATGNPALVYMQNAGLGNAVNPLVSLADKSVCRIPMVLLIGWRGEILLEGGQIVDEPQHLMQGAITGEQLDLLDIPYCIIDAESDIQSRLQEHLELCNARGGPVALLVRKGSFTDLSFVPTQKTMPILQRETALHAVLDIMQDGCVFVATTGMLGRELYARREDKKQSHATDFLCVGGMGHAIAIATGLASSGTTQRVVCLDGDGAMLMHMGSLVASARCTNLIHIVFNNEVHDSVGGQPTQASAVDMCSLALACGYAAAVQAQTVEDIADRLAEFSALQSAAVFIEIVCAPGGRSDLPRPALPLHEYCALTQQWLEDS